MNFSTDDMAAQNSQSQTDKPTTQPPQDMFSYPSANAPADQQPSSTVPPAQPQSGTMSQAQQVGSTDSPTPPTVQNQNPQTQPKQPPSPQSPPELAAPSNQPSQSTQTGISVNLSEAPESHPVIDPTSPAPQPLTASPLSHEEALAAKAPIPSQPATEEPAPPHSEVNQDQPAPVSPESVPVQPPPPPPLAPPPSELPTAQPAMPPSAQPAVPPPVQPAVPPPIQPQPSPVPPAPPPTQPAPDTLTAQPQDKEINVPQETPTLPDTLPSQPQPEPDEPLPQAPESEIADAPQPSPQPTTADTQTPQPLSEPAEAPTQAPPPTMADALTTQSQLEPDETPDQAPVPEMPEPTPPQQQEEQVQAPAEKSQPALESQFAPPDSTSGAGDEESVSKSPLKTILTVLVFILLGSCALASGFLAFQYRERAGELVETVKTKLGLDTSGSETEDTNTDEVADSIPVQEDGVIFTFVDTLKKGTYKIEDEGILEYTYEQYIEELHDTISGIGVISLGEGDFTYFEYGEMRAMEMPDYQTVMFMDDDNYGVAVMESTQTYAKTSNPLVTFSENDPLSDLISDYIDSPSSFEKSADSDNIYTWMWTNQETTTEDQEITFKMELYFDEETDMLNKMVAYDTETDEKLGEFSYTFEEIEEIPPELLEIPEGYTESEGGFGVFFSE